MRLVHFVPVIALVGCAQSNEVVPIADAPSYMLLVGGARVLDGDIGSSALPGTELRMDPELEGGRVIVMLAPGWSEPRLFEGDAAASPIRLTLVEPARPFAIDETRSDGFHSISIDTVVLDGYVEDGALRFDRDVTIEGSERVDVPCCSGPRMFPTSMTSRVRATAAARVDDVAPTGILVPDETMIGGILPWQAVDFRVSEPIARASIEAATGSDPLAVTTTEIRGQVAGAAFGPTGWWSAVPAVTFPGGVVDRIPNAGTIGEPRTFQRIADVAPAAGFDFEASEAGVLRASDGAMFLASELGCYGGSAGCLGFAHDGGLGGGSTTTQHSEIFARLSGTMAGIRLRVRVLGEMSSWGSTEPVQFRVTVRAAAEGSPAETVAVARVTTTMLPMPAGPFVSDSGWQEVALDFPAPVDGAGVHVAMDAEGPGFGAWRPVRDPAGAGAGAPLPPAPAATVLVDDLGAI